MSKILEFKDNNKNGKEKIVGKMEIKNQTEKKAELYFYGDIVSSTWSCWEEEDKCPQDVTNFLKEIENIEDIDIYINSGGGSVFAGIAIYNQLKRHNGFKTVHVDGLAASIASVIALVGDKIIMPTNAQLMIHKPWTGTQGANATELRKLADSLDTIEQSILNIYQANLREGVGIETIKQMVNDETWLTGEEASQYFNIEIDETEELVACTSQYFNHYRNVPKNLSSKQVGSIENNKNNVCSKIENLINSVNVLLKNQDNFTEEE